MNKFTTGELTEALNGVLVGDANCKVWNLNRIETAAKGDVTFLGREEYEKYMTDCPATCVIVPLSYTKEPAKGHAYIKVENPHDAFMSLVKRFADHKRPAPGIHPSAIVEESAKVKLSASIGARCYVGSNCEIGDKVVLMPGVVLYDNVRIASKTIVHSNTVCYSDVEIGANCVIHAGAVIGADGFGFTEDKATGAYEKVPQIGNVVIGDDVEIGANTTIDRAMLGSTILENGVKLDNLVHVAHNCTLGEHTAIAAQTGVSGSTKIGKRNRFGGQVGFAGHMETCDDVTIIAQSGVSKSVTKPGIYFGSPIKDRLTAFKIEACIRKLPELFSDVENLKKSIQED